jgi:endonuclease YncB( thermonuclease family)
LNPRKQRLWFLGFFLFFCRLPAFEATVVLVVSGDSLVVETAPPQKRYRIHLAGIDAPEMPKGSLQGQPYALEARAELTKICMGSTVSVLVEKAHEYDGHYAILIAKNGICINTYLVESGLAVLTGIDDRYYNLKLEDSCNFARQNRWGIWSLARLETPFEYRQRTKKRHLD